MFAMTVVSCDKDDDDEPKVSLKFNPNKAEVAVGSTVKDNFKSLFIDLTEEDLHHLDMAFPAPIRKIPLAGW